MKVTFLYNAQLHQIPHSLPIALELAEHHRDIEVDIAATDPTHLAFAHDLAQRYGAGRPARYMQLRRPWYVQIKAAMTAQVAPNKRRSLFMNLPYFAGCQAIVTPERTSLALKRAGVIPATRMIYTGHGAGDRAMLVAPEIGEFDYVLNAGRKVEQRRLAAGLLRPGAYTSGVYAKFDWALRDAAQPPRLFDNDRPTVLYSPHFDPELSSWPLAGQAVLDWFASNTRYNLVFAPHVRLFDPPRAYKYFAFRRYRGLRHLRIDLGSPRCIDMSYVLGADAYLGDVSSQIAEFLVRPRPCLFLNPRRTDWEDRPEYRFWTLGPVLDDAARLESALAQAFASHADYLPAQRRYFEETFDGAEPTPTARRGADAIARYLRDAS